MPDYPAITRLLAPLADPVRAAQMQAYMKNRFPFLGIPKPQLKATLKPHLKAAARESVNWQTIDACWQAEAREYQYAALELLRAVGESISALQGQGMTFVTASRLMEGSEIGSGERSRDAGGSVCPVGRPRGSVTRSRRRLAEFTEFTGRYAAYALRCCRISSCEP